MRYKFYLGITLGRWFLPVFHVLMLTGLDTGVENAFAFSALARKNHMELGQGSEMAMRTQYTTEWDDHQIFVLNIEWPSW